MSLIRDALERAREEAERQRAGGVAPSRSYRRPAATPRGPWVIAAVSGLIGAALAGGGLYLALAHPTSPPPTPSQRTTAAPVVAGAASAAGAPSAKAPDPSTGNSASLGEPDKPSATTPPSPAAAAQPERSPAPSLPRPAIAPAPAVAPPPAEPAAKEPAAKEPAAERIPAVHQASPPPAVYAGEATTPGGATMGLGGIAFSASGPVALVNGKPLGVGEGLVSSVGEAFVVESIDRDRVTLVSAGVRLVIVLR